MLLGAVVAWAILGPFAHSLGWVSLPGSKQPDDATGWLAWVALSIMLMDSVVRARLAAWCMVCVCERTAHVK